MPVNNVIPSPTTFRPAPPAVLTGPVPPAPSTRPAPPSVFGGDNFTRTTVPPVGTHDREVFDLGEVRGQLRASVAAYDRIKGSFDVYQWHAFADLNYGAMQDALASLKADPAVAARYALTVGFLEGGIQSYEAIHGSFDVYQWHAFSDMNRRVIGQALAALNAQQ